MTTCLKRPFISLNAYFELDRDATERLEYRNGEVRAMGGAQPEHNTICANVIGELRSGLRGSGCRPFTSDQRVKVNAGSPYLYPDVALACAPQFVSINGLRTLVNPTLIVEVTSPITAQDDRGAKFLQYQTSATLTDYLLVDSTAVGVLHYQLRDGQWQPQLLESIDDRLLLPTLGLEIPLCEIYLDAWPETAQGGPPDRHDACEGTRVLGREQVSGSVWPIKPPKQAAGGSLRRSALSRCPRHQANRGTVVEADGLD
jgi:Uma2 family endonuclease